MKNIKIILALLCMSYSITGQNIPLEYKLENENKKLLKSNDDNPRSNSINDIVAANDEVWLGTSKGVSKTTNNGDSWINYFGSPSFPTNSISALTYKNGIVYSASARTVERDGQFLPEGTGMIYTTNNGETWNWTPQSIDAQDDDEVIYGINALRALPITTAINNLTYDIAVTGQAIFTANFAGGLRKSTNLGISWSRVVLPPDNKSSIKPTDTLNFSLQPVAGAFGNESHLNHRVFSVCAVDDSLIYVGTANGINKSTDGGVSWVKFNHQNQTEPISGNFVVALAYNYSTNSIWAATWRAEDNNEYNAVSASFDGGATWKIFLEGEKAHNFGFKDGHVIAATDNGAFRTYNNGLTWILPGEIKDHATQVELPTKAFYSAGSRSNDVFIGSDKGLARISETSNFPWVGDWRVYLASEKLISKDETFAFPNPFSPASERVAIKYSTNGKRAKATVRIFDFGMNLVRTVAQNVERGDNINVVDGYHNESNSGVIDYWDGRDERGNICPNGVYFYRVDIDDNEPLFGKIMIIM